MGVSEKKEWRFVRECHSLKPGVSEPRYDTQWVTGKGDLRMQTVARKRRGSSLCRGRVQAVEGVWDECTMLRNKRCAGGALVLLWQLVWGNAALEEPEVERWVAW